MDGAEEPQLDPGRLRRQLSRARFVFPRLAAALLLALALLTGALSAQETGPDYGRWGEVAKRAEASIEAGQASDDALMFLRVEADGAAIYLDVDPCTPHHFGQPTEADFEAIEACMAGDCPPVPE